MTKPKYSHRHSSNKVVHRREFISIQFNSIQRTIMALQLGLRRGLTPYHLSLAAKSARTSQLGASVSQMRWKSTDVGDVIGIDLGTTNSCVSIMVSS
jgi:hypothetical protein